MDIMWAGVIAAVAMILLFLKMDLRKVLGYDIPVDILFTGGLAYMLSGTYSGMMAALLGGAILSMFLFVTKYFLGYKRLMYENNRLVWKQFD